MTQILSKRGCFAQISLQIHHKPTETDIHFRCIKENTVIIEKKLCWFTSKHLDRNEVDSIFGFILKPDNNNNNNNNNDNDDNDDDYYYYYYDNKLDF